MPSDLQAAPREPASDPIARLRGVACHLTDRRGHETQALAEVDLDLHPGELVGLLGPNGAGKSTLLRVLAGLLAPPTGSVEVLGQSAPSNLRGRPAQAFRRRRAYGSQDLDLDPEMTGTETLSLFAVLQGLPRRHREEQIGQVLEIVDLDGILERRVSSWSGGQRRRLHLALTLLGDPELLLLDEPTAGLDLSGSDRLWNELEVRTKSGRTVVVVSHDHEPVKTRAHRAIVMSSGQVRWDGPPSEILQPGSEAIEMLRSSAGPPASGNRRGRGFSR